MTPAVNRMRTALSPAADPLLALLLVVAGIISLSTVEPGPGVARMPDDIAYAYAVVLPLPLIVRKRWPLPVLGAILLGLIAFNSRGYPETTVDFFGTVVAFYTVAARYRPPIVALAGVACFLAIVTGFVIAPESDATIGDWLTTVILVIGTSLVGDIIRRRREYAAELELRTQQLEIARHELASQAVTEERLRMARELHDVVGHSMTAIIVQAAVAQQAIAGSNPRATTAVGTIESIARESLTELRAMLAVLRDDGPDLAPTARLADLDVLADRLRASGMHLDLRREGDLEALPPLVELAAFRIVQEALTNVVRHANGAWVNAVVRGDGHGVTIEVTDDGPAVRTRGNAEPAAPGKGLAGMQERAALLGGTFESGPVQGGGFRVAAMLPRGGAL